MALAPGTRLGVYEILSPLGEGGMGVVYRARDTRLDRDVAIKVLPDSFVADAERLARFEREAKTLAALNHPNIAQIHGLEESGGTHALVMELVDGEDLSHRIARGAISVDEALPIATQIAEALEAAHEQGIIHRDLKPANIKVRGDGAVKLLDFGLAKAIGRSPEAGAGPATLANSPTITSPALMTGVGVLLGTAPYMSPEQAQGRAVDKRSDVWAFGCVLYEMLTGTRAFQGDTITDVLGAIVKTEPDYARLPATTPPGIRRLLMWCLQKDAAKRLRDIGDAHPCLEGIEFAGAPSSAPRRSALAVAVPWVFAFAAAAAAVAVWITRETAATPAALRMSQVDKGPGITSPIISPDGSRVAYVRAGRVVVRQLDAVEEREIEGTSNASSPFWSADGRSIGYFSQSDRIQIQFVSADGAQRIVVSSGPTVTPFAPNRAADCASGLFFVEFGRGLLRLVEGKAPEVIAALDRAKGESNWSYPVCLPDGRIMAVLQGAKPTLTVIDGTRRIPLLELDDDIALPSLAQPDLIVFQRRPLDAANPGIWAVPVKPDLSATTGNPFLVLPDASGPSVSHDGRLVALTGLRRGDRQLVWTDRAGTRLGVFGRPQPRFRNPVISPDGSRVVVATGSANTGRDSRTTWMHYESSVRQWAKGAEYPNSPSWSPDGGSRTLTGPV